MTDQNNLTQRAYAAYMRSGEFMPKASGVVEHDGKTYVTVRIGGILAAVYRVKTDGFLKRLRRWPTAVEQ